MADATVVADNVTLIGENIQSKVGATLLGTKAVAEDTVKGSKPIESVLEQVRNLQEATVDKVTEVWEILKAQLDFEKDEARKLREQGRGPKGRGAAGASDADLPPLVEKQANSVLDFIKNNPLISAAGLILAFKTMGKTLVKGGFAFIIAQMLGDQIIKALNLEKDSMSAEAFGTYIPAGVLGAYLFKGKGGVLGKGGLAGALIVMAGTGIASVSSWMLGSKEFKDISTFDWGAASMAGVAATWGLGTVLTTFGMAGTLSAALLALPVIIAVGVGTAAAVGGTWLYGKVQEYEQKMNTELEVYAKQTQEDWEKAITTQKSGIADKFGLGEVAGALGFEQTQLEKQRAGTEGALDLVMAAEDKTKSLEPEQQATLIKTADKFINISPESLKAILKDRESSHDYMETLNNLMLMAQHGAFGPDESKRILSRMLTHFQTVQTQSSVAAKELKAADESVPGHLTDITMGRGTWGGDLLEKRARDKEALKPMTDKQDQLRKELVELKKIAEEDPSRKNTTAVQRKENELGSIAGRIERAEKSQAKHGVKGLDWALIENVLSETTLTKLSEANMKVIAKIIRGHGAVLENNRDSAPAFYQTSNIQNTSNVKKSNYVGIHSNEQNLNIRNNDFLYTPIRT
jgi:hypothetical protein